MNTENIVTAIEKFFLEIIGQLLPGFLLLVGFCFVLPENILEKFTLPNNIGGWALVGASYATGCALTALGSYIFVPVYIRIAKSRIVSFFLPINIKNILLYNREIDRDIEKSAAFKYIKCQFPDDTSFRTLRNVAMSSINTSDKETTVRFIFFSLLSQGIATSILLLAFIQVGLWALNDENIWQSIGETLAFFLFSFTVALPFILREREFFDRARRLPIDAFFATFKPEKASDNTIKTVYLSGGHYSGWQNKVIESVKEFDYKDPSKNGLSDPKLYTQWDLEAIRQSDIILAYFESENPGGYALSLEVGYAAALGKHIIFIDEKSQSSPDTSRYLKIVQETSHVVFDSLADGINYLKSLS